MLEQQNNFFFLKNASCSVFFSVDFSRKYKQRRDGTWGQEDRNRKLNKDEKGRLNTLYWGAFTWHRVVNFTKSEFSAAPTSLKTCIEKPPSGFTVKPGSCLDSLSLCAVTPFLWGQGSPSQVTKVHQQSLHTWSSEKCFSDDCAEHKRQCGWSATGLRKWPVALSWAFFIGRETALPNPLKPWSLRKLGQGLLPPNQRAILCFWVAIMKSHSDL